MRMVRNLSVSHLVNNLILIIVESDGLVRKVEVGVGHYQPFPVLHLLVQLMQILVKALRLRLIGQVVRLRTH